MGRRIFNTIGVLISIGVHKTLYDEIKKNDKKIENRISPKKSFWDDIFKK